MRVGVIGFGKAGRQHADAARRSGEAELVAVADPAPAAAQAADALGVRCWPDYEAMLDAVDLDAVVISLPHAALPAAALAAAGRGRHVLLEKPMAATSPAAYEVVQACRAAKVRLMVNFVHRFRAEYRQAHAAVQAGAIGRPVLVVDVMASGRSDLPGWVWDHETAGGGMMMYNGIHSIDRLAWLAGSPITRVSGDMGTFCYPVADEDSAIATVTFHNGALGAVIQHKSDAPATLAAWQTTVYGTNGGIQRHQRSRSASGFRQGALRRDNGGGRPLPRRVPGVRRRHPRGARPCALGRRRPARPAGGRSAVRSGALRLDRDDRRGSVAWRSR